MEAALIFIGDYVFHILLIMLILATTYVAAKVARKLFKNLEKSYAQQQTRFGYQIPKLDITRYRFLIHLTTGIIYFIGIVCALSMIPAFRHVALSILASSGVLAIIVGFASQQTFSNIICGFLIEIFKPIKVGDKIQLPGKDIIGIVEDITLRDTILRTDSNDLVIIPNSVISGEIIENLTWDEQRTYLEVYLDYTDTVDKAVDIMQTIIQSDPRVIDMRPDVLKSKSPNFVELRLVELTLNGVHIQYAFWVHSENDVLPVKSALSRKIKEALDREKITFARDVY